VKGLHEWEITHDYAEGTNILGLVVFSTVMGITLGKMGPKGAPLLGFFSSLSQAMMIITGWVIWYALFLFFSSPYVIKKMLLIC
jgi:solute carrier family 1 (glial high affinity glutamate transporter), member 3